jgi:hypothetical protein
MNDVERDFFQTGQNFLAVILCSIALCLPGIWNGAPFAYFDTAFYLSHGDKAARMVHAKPETGQTADRGATADEGAPQLGGDDGSVIAGRSIYYSLFAWIGLTALGSGGVTAIQASVLSVLVVMCLRMVWPLRPPAAFLSTAVLLAAALSLLTSAGLFTALIMPDAWAGMLIVSFALLLAGGEKLRLGSRLVLGAVMALAALFHTSHILLLGAMIGVFALTMAHPGWRRVVPPSRLLLPALALLCGMAGQLAFSAATASVTGQKPIGRPFVTAHLLDLGPGTRFAKASCPDSGFAICPYIDRLPIDWISFLFDSDPETGIFAAVPPEVQRAIAGEQARFALATLKAEPLATSAGLLGDGIAQLWHLSVEDVPMTRADEAFLTTYFTPRMAEVVRRSSIYDRPDIAGAYTVLIQIGTGLSALALLVLALAGRLPHGGPLAMLLLVCATGLVLNALVCGVFASPYGRFQARVSWLLPFILLITLMFIHSPAAVTQKEGAHDL